MPHFDWTINLTELGGFIVFLIGLVKSHMDNRSRLDKIDFKVNTMFEWFQRNVINKE